MGNRLCGIGIENVCGVDEFARPTVTGVPQPERQIDLGRNLVDVDRLHGKGRKPCRGDTACGELGHRVLIECEQDLAQWRKGFRTWRVERLDDGLEGEVGMREAFEVDAAHAIEELGEGQCGVDAHTQDERVDEHSDQRIEHWLPATRDRGRDRDVIRPRQSGEQRAQRPMHDHERSDPGRACQLDHTLGHGCRDVE
ncbi:Uncharacterised protein [Mycobacteroides abscessus subsp. abscessus]|nr:Uncharacterised protein [Mycobacteroides abscessus subsp. abscessus]